MAVGTDKFDKPSAGDKVILALLRAKKKIGKPLIGKEGKKRLIEPLVGAKHTTKRTQQITERLKKAGISDSLIEKLRRKPQ